MLAARRCSPQSSAIPAQDEEADITGPAMAAASLGIAIVFILGIIDPRPCHNMRMRDIRCLMNGCEQLCKRKFNEKSGRVRSDAAAAQAWARSRGFRQSVTARFVILCRCLSSYPHPSGRLRIVMILHSVF